MTAPGQPERLATGSPPLLTPAELAAWSLTVAVEALDGAQAAERATLSNGGLAIPPGEMGMANGMQLAGHQIPQVKAHLEAAARIEALISIAAGFQVLNDQLVALGEQFASAAQAWADLAATLRSDREDRATARAYDRGHG